MTDEKVTKLEEAINANASKLDTLIHLQSASTLNELIQPKPESKKEPEKSDVSMDEIKKIVDNFDL